MTNKNYQRFVKSSSNHRTALEHYNLLSAMKNKIKAGTQENTEYISSNENAQQFLDKHAISGLDKVFSCLEIDKLEEGGDEKNVFK